MTNEEIVAKIQTGENVSENMGLLYEHCKGFIYSRVKTFADSIVDIDDLMQESYFALANTANRYDPEKGYSFISWLKYDLRNAMIKFADKNAGIPSRCSELFRAYKKMVVDDGDDVQLPDDKEVADSLGISLKKAEALRTIFLKGRPISFDVPIPGKEYDTESLYDTLGDEGFEDELIDNIDRENSPFHIWDEVDKLSKNQAKVLHLKYQNGLSNADIVNQMGYKSYQSVWMSEQRAFKKLKENISIQEAAKDRGFGDYALYHDGMNYFRSNQSSRVEYIALKNITHDEEMKLLTDRERAFYTMKQQGLKLKEIAQKAGCSTRWVTEVLHRANQKVQAYRDGQTEMKEVI